jgi:hypothetical protein
MAGPFTEYEDIWEAWEALNERQHSICGYFGERAGGAGGNWCKCVVEAMNVVRTIKGFTLDASSSATRLSPSGTVSGTPLLRLRDQAALTFACSKRCSMDGNRLSPKSQFKRGFKSIDPAMVLNDPHGTGVIIPAAGGNGGVKQMPPVRRASGTSSAAARIVASWR